MSLGVDEWRDDKRRSIERPVAETDERVSRGIGFCQRTPDRCILLFNRTEGSIAVLDDVRVTDVGI